MLKNPLNDLPGYALRRAAVAMMTELNARLADCGLRYSDTGVLVLIGANPGISATILGQELGVQRANLTRLLTGLEQSGLIERTQLNGKSHAYRLTGKGTAAADHAQQIVATFEKDLTQRVPEKHRAHLLPALLSLWQ
jgi:DNA-binding MarR family transcriptional regulator